MYPAPGIYEGADEPRPYRSLVIRRVAVTQIPHVGLLVVGLRAIQGSQSIGRQQSLAHRIHHRAPAARIENGEAERKAEDLIGPEAGIVAARPVDHVVEMFLRLDPEP